MSYIVHKTFNNRTYAYEITATWNSKLKQSRNTSKYLGVVDEHTKKISKFIKKPGKKERLILDFGDGYFLSEFIKKSDLYSLLETHFLKKCPDFLPLIIYRLCMQSAMYNCENWIGGNVINILLGKTNLSSQRISDILLFLSQEEVQRAFFVDYLKLVGGSEKSVIIDTTSMPTSIGHDFNAWGKSRWKD